MRIRRTAGAMALLTAAALVGAACSSDADEPTARSGGDAPAADVAVDPTALDTGTYATTPRPEFGTAEPVDVPGLDAQRMAEFMVLPFEIDPAFSDINNSGVAANGLSSFIWTVPPEVSSNFLYAYKVWGQTPPPPGTQDAEKNLGIGVIRFPDAEAAQAGARSLHEANLPAIGDQPARVPSNIDIAPNTLVSSQETTGNQFGPATNLSAYTPVGDYVIYTWAEAPTEQASALPPLVAKVLAQQEPLILQFPAIKTKAQTADGQGEKFQIDQDKVLIYTLPPEGEVAENQNADAVYGARGMVANTQGGPDTLERFVRTGVEHVARAGTTVFRTDTAEHARELFDSEIANWEDPAGRMALTDAFTPKGFEGYDDVQCRTDDLNAAQCIVVSGRYVGVATGSALDKTVVSQKISAQYLILQQADQSAT